MVIRAESWEFILKPMVHNTVRYRAAANETIMERMAVRTMNLDQCAVEKLGERGLQFSYGVPADLAPDVRTASKHFEKVEVWRKREVMKDPIVVGVLGDQRYI